MTIYDLQEQKPNSANDKMRMLERSNMRILFGG